MSAGLGAKVVVVPKSSSSGSARPRGRPGKSRPALLEAAIAEFAEKGFEGATTAAIARRANENQPLVHHHFGSKEELFRTVLDVLFDELRKAILPPEERPGDLTELLRRFVLFTARRPELARIWLIECARGGDHAEYVLEKHIVPLAERVRAVFAMATREGALPDVDPTMLLYAAQGLASYPFLVPEQVRRLSGCDARSVEFAERYTETVMVLLGLARR